LGKEIKEQTSGSPLFLDSYELRIQDEVEEFLQDLTLEFPFQEIFETLRRFEFYERYGNKVIPLPKVSAKSPTHEMKKIRNRILVFLDKLETDFGQKYAPLIQKSFHYYTETTRENE